MSYNISAWRTKENESFTLALSGLSQYEDRDRRAKDPVVTDILSMRLVIEFPTGDGRLVGTLTYIDGLPYLKVNELSISGEFSGTFLDIVLKPAFKNSFGKYVASVFWEELGVITKLIVRDGIVSEHEVEL